MTIIRSGGLLLAVLFIGGTAANAQNAPKLITEEFMVPTRQPGIALFLRNKRPDGMNSFSPKRTVLFVHGATYPSDTTFDLPVGGASWMDQIAQRGFDTYFVDLPATENRPALRKWISLLMPAAPSWILRSRSLRLAMP